MTVRLRWWIYVLGLALLAPAILLAWHGDWTPLLLLLAPSALAGLAIVAIIAGGAWSNRRSDRRDRR